MSRDDSNDLQSLQRRRLLQGAAALPLGALPAWALAQQFPTGLPISYYAAKYGVDMDLLTRGAGFGYLGSTLTSLV